MQNEVKDIRNENKIIRNENKELKSRISDLQDTVSDLEVQKAGFVKFSQFDMQLTYCNLSLVILLGLVICVTLQYLLPSTY